MASSRALTTEKDVLSPEELTALLRKEGWAEAPSGESFPRIKLDGQMLVTPDGGMYMYNPRKPAEPAMSVRIVKPPEEYFAMYVTEQNARDLGRPELGNTFSKRYLQPDAARRVWPSDEAFDDIKAAGLLDDYGKPLKPAWKADVLVQIMPEDGALKGDEAVHALTLSTTSVIEFKGTSKEPSKGAVSDKNFITKLSEFAQQNRADDVSPSKAVIDALTSLQGGGVVAELRIERAENKDAGRSWSVIVWDPIHIEPLGPGDALLQSGE